MNKGEFLEELKKLNIQCNEKILNQLNIYYLFLKEYNSHTNITRITNEEDVYLKHFYDSLTICKAINLNKIDNLIDLGTGAGFPGMVLKIFFPNIKVTLLDSNNKKIKFLKELSQRLNVDVELINSRIEEFSKNNLNKYDLVVSRAVANMRVLSELSIPLVKKEGLFVAMKGKIDDSLENSKETIDIMNGKVDNIISFSLKNDEDLRTLIVVKKIENSNINTIRTYDRILKKPLVKKS